jgi:hypothetical protein
MHADYNYTEPEGSCELGHPVLPFGAASGIFTIGSSFSGSFSWTRIGVTALIFLTHPTGIALAGFVPPTGCWPPDARVAGVAVIV